MGNPVCCLFRNCICFVRSVIVPCLAKWIDSQVAAAISRRSKRAVAFGWTLFPAIRGFNNGSDLTAADSDRHILCLAVPTDAGPHSRQALTITVLSGDSNLRGLNCPRQRACRGSVQPAPFSRHTPAFVLPARLRRGPFLSQQNHFRGRLRHPRADPLCSQACVMTTACTRWY